MENSMLSKFRTTKKISRQHFDLKILHSESKPDVSL